MMEFALNKNPLTLMHGHDCGTIADVVHVTHNINNMFLTSASSMYLIKKLMPIIINSPNHAIILQSIIYLQQCCVIGYCRRYSFILPEMIDCIYTYFLDKDLNIFYLLNQIICKEKTDHIKISSILVRQPAESESYDSLCLMEILSQNEYFTPSKYISWIIKLVSLQKKFTSGTTKFIQWYMRNDDLHWYYIDLQNTEQGPFDTSEMEQWFEDGYLPNSLMVKANVDGMLVKLETLNHYKPFASYIDQTWETSEILKMHECKELKIAHSGTDKIYLLKDWWNQYLMMRWMDRHSITFHMDNVFGK
eukprot:532966_1